MILEVLAGCTSSASAYSKDRLPLKLGFAPGLCGPTFESLFMSSAPSQPPEDHEHDPIEDIVPMMPIVLPIGGAVLIFLLAFIAVSMA